MKTKKSRDLFDQAKKIIPGGVNSPVRAFKPVGGNPLFIKKGEGSKIYDADGNEFIDYVGSWGPHLFGHNPPFIKKAVQKALEKGTSFGAPTENEIKLAKLIKDLVPSVEMVRMVNSGTEATMSAVRAARAYTGKEKIIKFEGCYHGHVDYFLIKAGSGALTLGIPTSPGVTKGNAADTLTAEYNNIESVKKLFSENRNQIASVILEAVAGNMGVVRSTDKFIKDLFEICREEKAVIIFDEVMTGFRVAKGGAQELYGVNPDLSTFGKIIGGGLPVGAFGGKKEIMEMIAPAGPVYQAGTLSGNPLAISAGLAALNFIKENPEIYKKMEKKSSYLAEGFSENMRKLKRKFILNRVGSMFTLFFTEEEVNGFNSAVKADTELFARYFNEMLKRGIYLPPSQFEAVFISAAHSTKDLDKTISANYDSLETLSLQG